MTVVAAAALSGSSVASAGTAHRCPKLDTTYIKARNIRVDHGLHCRGARALLRRYFRKVVATAQTPRGCAQRRSPANGYVGGCAVGDYACFAEGGRQLRGYCENSDWERVVSFLEFDRGPGG